MPVATITQLNDLATQINIALGKPTTTWFKKRQKDLTANIGNFHVVGTYGGFSLFQITNIWGECKDVFSSGYMSKKELKTMMSCFLLGINEGKEQ